MGIFELLDKAGNAAYHLALPFESKLHPVFHFCTKKFHGVKSVEPLLYVVCQGVPFPTPQAILDYCVSVVQREALIHWEGLSHTHASWEAFDHLALCSRRSKFRRGRVAL